MASPSANGSTSRRRPPKRSIDRILEAPLGEPLILIGLALAVGIIGGLGAVLFRLMIRWIGAFFTGIVVGDGLAFLGSFRHFAVAIVPALGLIVVGVITTYFAREVKGHGVPQILESLALHGGRIRPRVGAFGILAPAITIGAGGSVGREGPIALIGAAFGSTVGQWLHLDDKHIILLVACGAGAGIAATFNAPIAGGLFGLEIVLGSFAMGALVPVFVASVTAVETFRLIMGSQLLMQSPDYAFSHPTEIFFALLLGVLAGAVGLAYTRGLSFAEDLFDDWNVPFWVKATVGGVFVGLVGLALPQVLGVGYGTMRLGVAMQLGTHLAVPALLFLLLLVAKYAATITTIGAGGSGGVFAPSLFLGIMLGGTYGYALHLIAPSYFLQPGVFVIAGLGAVFAAAAQAPLTAMVIILEMTGDYHLTIGVIAACAISYLVYGSFARDSMYTVKLTRRGIRIMRGGDVRPLQQISVSAAMVPADGGLTVDTPIGTVSRALHEGARDALVIYELDGSLAGIVDAQTVFEATAANRQDEPVRNVVRPGAATVFPDMTLDDAMRRFAIYGVRLLPVVDRATPRRVVGTLGRGDALRAYNTHTLNNVETAARVRRLQEHGTDEGSFREFVVDAGSLCAGRQLKNLDIPPEAVVVSVSRHDGIVVPHGETELEAGDRVLVFAAPSDRMAAIASWFATNSDRTPAASDS